MKIIMINGSHRKTSATASILHEMYQKLETYPDVEIQFYNVADLNLTYCVGCCKCYKNGKCIYNDDIEITHPINFIKISIIRKNIYSKK